MGRTWRVEWGAWAAENKLYFQLSLFVKVAMTVGDRKRNAVIKFALEIGGLRLERSLPGGLSRQSRSLRSAVSKSVTRRC